MKTFFWKDYTVQITKKKVKNTNVRIKREAPKVICMSIPLSASYESGLQALESPHIRHWLKNYERKSKMKSVPTLEEQRQKELEKEQMAPVYRDRLLALLPDMFRKWEPILGVRSSKVTIRKTRSQWGSCNTRNGNISISLWLGAYPEECIEYVVVHELVHLLERGHNAHFYGILDQYYPDWKICRERLKKEP